MCSVKECKGVCASAQSNRDETIDCQGVAHFLCQELSEAAPVCFFSDGVCVGAQSSPSSTRGSATSSVKNSVRPFLQGVCVVCEEVPGSCRQHLIRMQTAAQSEFARRQQAAPAPAHQFVEMTGSCIAMAWGVGAFREASVYSETSVLANQACRAYPGSVTSLLTGIKRQCSTAWHSVRRCAPPPFVAAPSPRRGSGSPARRRSCRHAQKWPRQPMCVQLGV